SNQNPALERFADLFDETPLAEHTKYRDAVKELREQLRGRPALGAEAGATGSAADSLLELLEAPMRASPTSLDGQLRFVRERWGVLLGTRFQSLLDRIVRSLDVLEEERRSRGFGGPGPSVVPGADALRGTGREEYEAFSSDEGWMPRLVMIAKSTYVWLDQLSKRYGRDISRLDQIPDEVLDELAERGFSGLWLIGLWERSEASKRIKHLRGQPDAVASAYALYDYQIAGDLGGDAAYGNLRDRAWQRGVRLAGAIEIGGEIEITQPATLDRLLRGLLAGRLIGRALGSAAGNRQDTDNRCTPQAQSLQLLPRHDVCS
ncbi:MAG: hypothetical protein R3360_02555, partial [Alphaproteobacteria bacterium]|nr:hypothetical protein [Alphaproteobacteria bacterium]